MSQAPLHNSLVFGKDETSNIVSIEITGDKLELFTEKDGIVSSQSKNHRYWTMSPRRLDNNWIELDGDLHYKWIKLYTDKKNFYYDKRRYEELNLYSVSNDKESAMLLKGYTYYKNMKVNDVSVLSFDIESMGLEHDRKSRILLISNTFRSQGKIIRKLFAYDDYDSDKEFIDDWCAWVRKVNPSIMVGHNVFSYDLPYMNFCAKQAGTTLALGRNDSDVRFEKYTSKFRKDGSQDYEYNKCHIYGREIVDTMFVAYHFDFARKYESYGLKQIIKQEGLEIAGRQFYDAGTIKDKHLIPEEWEKIKRYAEHDADDALALYDLMIPAYFYLSQYMPKSFQEINSSASGSQLNSFLVRSYLQDHHSIPKTTEVEKFKGAISFGVPGIYSNVFKLDFNAMYPNIIRSFKIYSKEKDPKAHLLKMTDYFTEHRLKNKKLYKETGNRYYYEMEQGAKVFINSIYGLMGASGLNFNFPRGAAMVTKIGRELLKFTVKWATNKDIDYWINLFNEKTGNEPNEKDM